MNRAQAIAHHKQIIAASENLILVAEQQKVTATRLKSEAESALRELGDSPGPGRKAPKFQLADDMQLQLKANLTRGAGKNRMAM